MKKISLSQVGRSVSRFATKNSPALLTALGVAGFAVAIYETAKATPKALRNIEEELDRRNEELYQEAIENGQEEPEVIEKLKPLDVLKVTWKCYLPVAITATLSAACVIGGCSVNMKRNAALATAYTLSETAFREYRDKVVETIGEKKEEAVRDSIAQDKVKENPVRNNEIIVTGKGETLCYDANGGRYFKSDINKIRRAENELNKRMLSEHYISLNEFYYEVGLSPVQNGDELGWNLDGGFIDTHFSSVLSENEEPCLAISFHIAPRYDFAHLM